VLACLGVAAPAAAQGLDAVPSLGKLVTGNGHGFQIFDADANAITQFLERPYRFVRANPANPDGDGIVRRELAYDTYFGVRVDGETAWLATREPEQVGYVDQSNVIRSVVTVGGVRTETWFYAPFGFEANALVMLVHATNTAAAPRTVTLASIHNFKLGSAPDPDAPGDDGESIRYDAAAGAAIETGPGGGAMVYAPIGGADVASCASDAYTTFAAGGMPAAAAACDGADRVQAYTRGLGALAPGASAWWGVAIVFAPADTDGGGAAARDAWTAFRAGRDAAQLAADALAEWEAWRTPPPPGLTADELAVWRQSEAVLRMAQIREPYQETPRRKNHGMLLASLPPGNWHIGWVRDAAYAVDALARTGHLDEARLALDFFLGADAGRYRELFGGVDYRISTVRYFGDGQEEADYSGAPTRNHELDGWGMVLWVARQYVDASGDTAWLESATRKGDTVYDALRAGVAEALAANLEPSGLVIADASIWEVHWGNRRHFLYTSAAAARGFCDMAAIARRAGRADDVARYRDLAARTRGAVRAAFVDAQGVLAGSTEQLAAGGGYRDGAAIEALSWGIVGPTEPIATATLGALSVLQTPAGGYKRREGSSDPYDNDEWILVDLRASAAFRRAGHPATADPLLAWVTRQAAANHDLLPELYNMHVAAGPIGGYAGSAPMVGFGAAAYQLALLDRAGLAEPADCGDADPGDPPDADTGDDDGDGGDGAGCACTTGGGRAPPWTAALVLALAATCRTWTRRRASARRARSAGPSAASRPSRTPPAAARRSPAAGSRAGS
jgi:GH15 family glucan-1,4-alpha-glucosidase